MIFRQLYDATSSTYTYLLGDETTREAMLIDPVFEQVQRDLALVRELKLELKLVVDTHAHADHITAAWVLKQKSGCKIASGEAVEAENVDIPIKDGQTFGVANISLQARSTPGHTSGCMTYVLEGQSKAFTGDALLIRGCGRSDFQQGDASKLYKSINEQIFTLPDDCTIYPAHDYSGRTCTSVGEEKEFNARVGGDSNEHDFVGYMNAMQLPHPKKIDEALPNNMRSGKPEDGKLPEEQHWADLRMTLAGFPEVEPEWVIHNQPSVTILDVRDENESIEPELKQMDNLLLIPLDELRDRVKEVPTDKPVVTLCRSGKRSSLAIGILKEAGHEKVANVHGGVLHWPSASR
jgi:glyoxylase-like metal-dependent hydrolase (beta-lactamase superfamily II)/rhodanese-related sulfurtransferase